MNVDCVGVRRPPNNIISGGRDAPPLMTSVAFPKAAVRDRPVWVQDLPDSGREPFSTDQQGIDGGAEQKRRSKRSDVRQTDR